MASQNDLKTGGLGPWAHAADTRSVRFERRPYSRSSGNGSEGCELIRTLNAAEVSVTPVDWCVVTIRTGVLAGSQRPLQGHRVAPFMEPDSQKSRGNLSVNTALFLCPRPELTPDVSLVSAGASPCYPTTTTTMLHL
ncbi:uncharacterized protein V6R79_015370 [Siganus canaliculatus]